MVGRESLVAVGMVGAKATVDLVKDQMTRHDVLHFATHAEQDEGLAEVGGEVFQLGPYALKS